VSNVYVDNVEKYIKKYSLSISKKRKRRKQNSRESVSLFTTSTVCTFVLRKNTTPSGYRNPIS
jgi:hypothetical protein